jgi:palmitoyltransferase
MNPGILTSENLDTVEKAYPYDGVLYTQIKYCPFCKLFQPARCRHCHICKCCVIRKDHHCAWINNCVGANNLRCFLLFIFLLVLTLIILIYLSIRCTYNTRSKDYVNALKLYEGRKRWIRLLGCTWEVIKLFVFFDGIVSVHTFFSVFFGLSMFIFLIMNLMQIKRNGI